jgi:hypothetical protein
MLSGTLIKSFFPTPDRLAPPRRFPGEVFGLPSSPFFAEYQKKYVVL